MTRIGAGPAYRQSQTDPVPKVTKTPDWEEDSNEKSSHNHRGTRFYARAVSL